MQPCCLRGNIYSSLTCHRELDPVSRFVLVVISRFQCHHTQTSSNPDDSLSILDGSTLYNLETGGVRPESM